MDFAPSLRKLAPLVGIPVQNLANEAKRPGFPPKTEAGYEVTAVIAWRAANIKQRKRPPVTSPSQSPTPFVPLPAPANPPVTSTDPFIQAMQSGNASALTISRAAMQIASRRVATAATAGTLGANDLDDLKKTLQELRQAESGYIELEQTRGQLIARDKVKQLVGGCCTRLVQALDVLIAGITTEVDLWIADQAFRDLPTDERHRRVREYVDRVCREVRQQEADGVASLIRKQAKSDPDDE